jgi:hypothetical protein
VEASLFNHSCQPNVCLFRMPDTPAFQFLAIGDIKKGEELNVTYGFSRGASAACLLALLVATSVTVIWSIVARICWSTTSSSAIASAAARRRVAARQAINVGTQNRTANAAAAWAMWYPYPAWAIVPSRSHSATIAPSRVRASHLPVVRGMPLICFVLASCRRSSRR